MTVQETHWSFTSEWQSQGHWLIHSSLEKPTRSAGILQILRQDFVSTQQVRTAHVVPGRLVHTRLATEPISLITVYQHCWSTNSTQTPTQDKLLEVREQLWTQLHRLVGSIAQRHQLVIAGDFNTPCLALEDRPHLVRAAVRLDRSAPTQKDHGRLQSLLRDHSLAAVSSFGRTAAAATYLSGSGPKTIKTRIDFILCRAHQSDRITKTARPLQHVPFVPTTGNRHLPLTATMPWPHRRLLPRNTPGPKKWTLTAINTVLGQCPELSQKYSHVVECRLKLHPCRPGEDPCDHLNAHLTRAWEDVVETLGIQLDHPRPEVAEPSLPETSIKQLWHLKHLLKQQPTTTFAQRSQALQLRQSVRNLQNELRKRSRQRKQERVDSILQQAESTASPSSLYRAVRLLAPKQRHCRIQLRDAEGQLMSPTGELQAIAAHFRSIYGQRTTALQAPVPQSALSFDPLEVQQALARLPASKALPPEYAPAGETPQTIAGGLSLSLDIDKAFDSLPRDQLVLAMQEAALTSEEIALAVHIHEAARLHFQISDQETDLPLQQGIRQGCGLSPLLWSLATSRLYQVYLRTTQERREPAGEPTLYADDVWTSWLIHSQEQFKASLRAAGTLIQILEEAGLRVSPTKTVMLYALQGTAARSTLKAKLTKLDTGCPDPHLPWGEGWQTYWRLSKVLEQMTQRHLQKTPCFPTPALEAVRLHVSKSHQLQVRQAGPTEAITSTSEAKPEPALQLATSPAGTQDPAQKHLFLVPSPEQHVPFPADERGRFLWLHGREGLSQCRHCLRKCNTWYDLRVHITTKACSVLAPDGYTELPAKLNLNPRPLFHQPELQLMLAEDWERVASWIKLHRPQAQHYCPFCHQWLLQPRGLRGTPNAGSPQTFSLRYLTHSRSFLLPMAILQPEPINPEDLHEATKELDAINAQMKLVDQRKLTVATPLGRASMPMSPLPAPEGELGQGAMPMLGVSNSDNNQEERPAKWQRENFKGGTSQGKGKGHSGRGSQMVQAPQQSQNRQPAPTRRYGRPQPPQQPPRSWGRQGYAPSSESEIQHLQSMCHTMARLLMRHEDALSILQQSTTWVLFLTTQQPRTIIPELYSTAQAWYDLKQNNAESITLPMRTILWQKLMSMLAQRAQKVLDDQEAQAQAEDLDLYDPNHGFKYQKWDNKEGAMKMIPGKDPLPAKRIVEIAKELSVLSTGPGTDKAMRAWRNPARQQDAADFLLDEGGVCPLILSGIHDAATESGIATKLHHRIKAEPDILLPQWTPTGILWRTYQLHAMIQHIGDSATTGHYRAALQPATSSRPPDESWFHTDDNQEAQRVNIDALETTSYILFYKIRHAEDGIGP
ncbi:unnamed protein product [Symbiodinium necroappetens]|uniref:Reverse transcriptase domain-containing protein n=1 Tax=Symbiodinium necroappetens TaxID=1628268 RepID=A0A812VWA3_9DINO|nr:unnamed protein product [Symbiodinium necroappetens]